MAKKANTKKGSKKSSTIAKKAATKKAVAKKATAEVAPDPLEKANARIAELEAELSATKAKDSAEIEKPNKPPGCTLHFPQRR